MASGQKNYKQFMQGSMVALITPMDAAGKLDKKV